jgi:CrcB protein
MVEPAYLVGIGGSIGATARYLVGQTVEHERVPAATLTVNVLGSFVLGLVAFLGISGDARLLIGTGVCGSFTTFSSFTTDTVRLWETGERWLAVGFALGNFAGAVLAIGLAWQVAALA